MKKSVLLSILVVFLGLAAVILILNPFGTPPAPSEMDVPIILYHHIADSGEGEAIIQEDVFLSHLDAIAQAGYETVSFDQLTAYVEKGVPLPEKPIVISFDDGYLSNYDIAWPALKERNMQGTIFVIGCSVGMTTYKETGVPIIPHFSYTQAQEMIDSGAISIQPHTYNMHQYLPLEPPGGRVGCTQREGETEVDYRQALTQDFTTAAEQLKDNTTETATVLSYPFGLYSESSEAISAQLGFQISLTTHMEQAHLVKGDMNSLRLLGRFSIDDCTPEELFQMIDKEDAPT